jgi:hypothetical protein
MNMNNYGPSCEKQQPQRSGSVTERQTIQLALDVLEKAIVMVN